MIISIMRNRTSGAVVYKFNGRPCNGNVLTNVPCLHHIGTRRRLIFKLAQASCEPRPLRPACDVTYLYVAMYVTYKHMIDRINNHLIPRGMHAPTKLRSDHCELIRIVGEVSISNVWQ